MIQDQVIEIDRPAWHGIATPEQWELSRAGVCKVTAGKDGNPDKLDSVCGALWVTGLTTGTAGDWGRLLAFVDHDGAVKTLAIPAARLHEDPAILARELANIGLRIIPGKERLMLAYLAAFETVERIPSAPRLGWMERTDSALAFVFPDGVLSAQGRETVVYQPERYSPSTGTVHSSGALEDWKSTIAAPAADSDVLLFALCAGLAAPWLKLANSDSFILHFWGTTSRGKTTIAQVAASVWGCGIDPAESPSLSMIRRWNATANGIEGMAEAHSDLPLCLDELGAGMHKDLTPLVYQLAGGQGKAAMSADRQLKAPRSWRVITVSTGELSIEAKLSEHAPAKGGTLHRALDVEVSDIATHLPDPARRAFVDTLKRNCATTYGSAGRAMLAAMMQDYPTTQDARAAAVEGIDKALKGLVQPHHAQEQVRALRRLALIAWAGVYAARHGVLPVTPARIWQATQAIAASWGSRTTGTDADRIIDAVRAFILENGSRFQTNNDMKDVPRRAGFVDIAAGRWMFTKAALMEAAPGHDAITIAKAIQKAGFLFTNDSKLCPKLATPAGRVRVYCVMEGLLSEDSTGQDHKTGGQGGQGGQTAPEQGFKPAHHAKSAGWQGGQTTGAGANPAHLPTGEKTEWADANPHQNNPRPPAHHAHPENTDSQDIDPETFQ